MARDPNMVMTCKACVAAGVDPPFTGTFGQLGSHSRTAHKKSGAPAPVDAAPTGAPDDLPPADALGPLGPDYTRTDERVPGGVTITAEGDEVPRKRSWRDRLWKGPDATRTDTPSAPTSTKERKPVRGKRAATDQLWGLAWRFIGGRLEKGGIDPVVGRCMVYQAPVAGDVLEKLTKGTIIDKLVQPLAERADELETAAALFMLPMLIGMLERNPTMAPVLLPLISDAIEVHLYAMVPIIQSERKKKERRAEALKELFPDAAPEDDPVAMVLGEMFAGTDFEDGFTPDAIARAQERYDAERGAA